MLQILLILLLPFYGTTLGAAGVFIPGICKNRHLSRYLAGFAAGIMTAASIWSLILPAIELTDGSVFPSLMGIWAGFLFLLGINHLIPYTPRGDIPSEGLPFRRSQNTMLTLAVSLHNLPEGMAVGVAAAGYLLGDRLMGYPALMTLTIGIALQNIPEGAIISMPLGNEGYPAQKAFWIGILSGIIEPVAAIITLVLAIWIIQILPCCLCFAAGAMLYVVVEELIPEMFSGKHSDGVVLAFCTGFTVMMTLDVSLG